MTLHNDGTILSEACIVHDFNLELKRQTNINDHSSTNFDESAISYFNDTIFLGVQTTEKF